MQIWSVPFVWKAPLVLVEDRPKMQLSGDQIRVELTGRKGVYAVELSREEAERIAELIGWVAPP